MNWCLTEGLRVVDSVCTFVSGEQGDGGCLSLALAINYAPF